MAEPRARPRQKGQVFNDNDLRELLFAYGDSPDPLPSTLSLLDEILTDFILETCHAAALCASYSRRQKIKADDFRWVVRKNPAMLGRIAEVMFREKWLKEQRRGMDISEGLGKGMADLEGVAEIGGVGEEGKKKGKGRGRGRRKRKADDDGDVADAQNAKKLKASP